MNVLTMPQPFAQLIVRGARNWIVRAIYTDYRGRLAIHASGAAPTHTIVGRSRRDPFMASEFAGQGWRDRDDLCVLPRSAVVGVVQLVRVVPVEQLDEAHEGLGDVNPGEFLLEFCDPVEISPVDAPPGKSRVWTLPDGVAAAVAAAEAAARATPSGDTDPLLAVQLAEDAAAAAADVAFWARQRERERVAAKIEAAIDARHAEHEAELKALPLREFWNEGVERKVARELKRYMKEHQVRGTGKLREVRVDHRIAYLGYLFGDREWMPVVEFEATVREHLRRECGLRTIYPGEKRQIVDPYEDFYAHGELEAQPRLYEASDGSVVATGFTELDHPRRRVRKKPTGGDAPAEGSPADVGRPNDTPESKRRHRRHPDPAE